MRTGRGHNKPWCYSGATRPLPRDWGAEELHGDPTVESRQGLDQRSKMEEVVPKMTRREAQMRLFVSFICQGTGVNKFKNQCSRRAKLGESWNFISIIYVFMYVV